MRNIIFITFILFLSCKNSELKTEDNYEYSELDSVMSKSKQNLLLVNESNKKSDSVVSGTINHTIKKINNLESENKKLKIENNELKNQINDVNDDGDPYIIRTISK